MIFYERELQLAEIVKRDEFAVECVSNEILS